MWLTLKQKYYECKFKSKYEYWLFSLIEREIDWEEDDETKIPIKQARVIDDILATEVSIYLLRRSTGFCGSLIDRMASIRDEFIQKYENNYETYIIYNDFY